MRPVVFASQDSEGKSRSIEYDYIDIVHVAEFKTHKKLSLC